MRCAWLCSLRLASPASPARPTSPIHPQLCPSRDSSPLREYWPLEVSIPLGVPVPAALEPVVPDESKLPVPEEPELPAVDEPEPWLVGEVISLAFPVVRSLDDAPVREEPIESTPELLGFPAARPVFPRELLPLFWLVPCATPRLAPRTITADSVSIFFIFESLPPGSTLPLPAIARHTCMPQGMSLSLCKFQGKIGLGGTKTAQI
jgi:hypothetical protein